MLHFPTRTRIRAALLGALVLAASQAATAATYTNISGAVVDFPLGALSFADELVSFAPGIIQESGGQLVPLPAFRDGSNTLGVPDMVTLPDSLRCFNTFSTADCRFASLGYAGELVVKFTDNRLVGSGTTALDLWVFEAGPSEPTYVDISVDGISWLAVGRIGVGSAGVDIDAFGVLPGQQFAWVRLRDDPLAGQVSGQTLGEDVDAIGAISSVAVVPLPAAGWLLASALGGLGAWRRRDR